MGETFRFSMGRENPDSKEQENTREEKEVKLEYLGLLDQYHRLWNKVRTLERMHRDALEVDQERDQVHKQLEALGRTLGKTKEEVLGDIIRREGSLEEYGLPSYGVISAEDMADYSFGSFNVETGSDNFSRRSIYAYEKKRLEEAEKYGYSSEMSLDEQVHDIGGIEHVLKMKKGDLLIVFTSSFTTDIELESVSIKSDTYFEKWRRAIQSARAFEEARPGSLTIGAFHETTTLIGVVVSAQNLEKFAAFLRNHQEEFSNRIEDIPRSIRKKDRAKIIGEVEEVYGRRSSIFKTYQKLRRKYLGEKK